MPVTLTDSFLVDGLRRTSDGYLACSAKVARTGIQEYRGWEVGKPDMDKVRIYRPPEQVFNADALHSMAHRPVTLTHPPEPVTAQNWSDYAVGHTGDEVIRDGEYVRVPLVLMDAAAIDAVEKGVRELSMGYSTDLKWESGTTPDGQTYDAIQTAIRANHLAVVPVARGGKNLRLGDGVKCSDCGSVMNLRDGEYVCDNCGKTRTADGIEFWDRDFSAEARKRMAKEGSAMPDGSFPIANSGDLHNAIKAIGRAKDPAAAKRHIIKRARALGLTSELPDDWETKDAVDSMKGRKMVKITIDGAPLEVADELTATVITNAFAKLNQELADAKAAKKKSDEDGDEMEDGFKKQLEAKDGEIAMLKKQLEDSAVSPAKLDALVKERSAVIDAAATVLPKDFAFDGKSVEEIRRAAVSVKLGDAAKDLSDAAVVGAFRMIDAKPVSGVNRLAQAIGDGQRYQHQISDADPRVAALQERDKYLRDAWKTK